MPDPLDQEAQTIVQQFDCFIAPAGASALLPALREMIFNRHTALNNRMSFQSNEML